MKRDDTRTKKCECPFKLRVYHTENDTWTFNVVCWLHNHALCYKLVGHPIVYRLNYEEKIPVFDMTLSMIHPKTYSQI